LPPDRAAPGLHPRGRDRRQGRVLGHRADRAPCGHDRLHAFRHGRLRRARGPPRPPAREIARPAPMDYVNLGPTGLKVSRICLGTMTYGSRKWREWVLEEEESRPFIRRALELGINFFDTADVYSLGASEEVLGRALKDFGPGRDRVVIATKVCGAMGDDPNQRGLSRKHIHHAIEDSLRRLGTDYVDLYQIHRFDPATPVGETMEALHDLVRAGKALHIGASSMWAWQFAKMLHAADSRGWTPFATMQNHYNLIYREEEREMLPLCADRSIGLLPWSAGSGRAGPKPPRSARGPTTTRTGCTAPSCPDRTGPSTQPLRRSRRPG